MPAKRVSMRRVREILRLKHECHATDRAIARSLGIARSTVGMTLERVAAAGLRWPLPATLTDRVLEAMLYSGRGSQPGAQGRTGLGPCPSRAAPAQRHSDVAVAGVPGA